MLQGLANVQIELIDNNLRYPHLLWDSLLVEDKRNTLPERIELAFWSVKEAYAKISQSSNRRIAKAFWASNVSWCDAFFRDMIFWAGHNVPRTVTWKSEIGGKSMANLLCEHYVLAAYFNGLKHINIPWQNESRDLNPVRADLIDDLRWHRIMRRLILRFYPLALFDGTLTEGELAFTGRLKPSIERFLSGNGGEIDRIVASAFARADLEFYRGLFAVFTERNLFSDDMRWVVRGFLQDYEKHLGLIER